MRALRSVPPISRRSLEIACAALTCLLAAALLFEPSVSGDWVPIPTTVWAVASVVVVGGLALSVVIDAVAHLLRLVAAFVGSGERLRSGDTTAVRIGTSLVFGWLGAYVLYLVVASLYVLVAPVGGVLIAPLFALVFGGILGTLVLLQTLLARLFPESPVSRMRATALE